MKKKLFLILPISFLLCSCSASLSQLSIGGWRPFAFLENEEEQENNGEKKEPEVEDLKKHANKLNYTSGYPNAPFYLKVGDTRELRVTLDPTPEDDSEKVFTWELTGNYCEIPENETSNKITVKGVSSGTSTLKVTNTYNKNLTKSYTIKVIEFDEEKDYLWQYSSSDRASFGYNSKTATAGVASGDANLNGMTWHFTRQDKDGEDLVTSLYPESGAIGFGKGESPEHHVHFEAENTRKVKQIIMEVGSANSLATMTIKVGETTYFDSVTVPKANNGVYSTLKSNVSEFSSGKIEIDVITPPMDDDRVDDPTYYAPGAFYLKSILIHFDESLPDNTLTLVKAVEDITTDTRYLIVGESDVGFTCLNGAETGSEKIMTGFNLENFELNETITMPASEYKYGFTGTIDENSKLNFTSDNGNTVGVTAKNGTLSCTKTDKVLGWDYTIDENRLVMSIEDEEEPPKTKYFGVNKTTGKFSAYAQAFKSTQGVVYLYKFAA